jgi:exopolyphosphatase/guanosine-5'-triphosphate,3'-diphosphate pyrophosphatase
LQAVEQPMTVVDIGSGSMKASVFAKAPDGVRRLSTISRGFRLCQRIGDGVTDDKIKVAVNFIAQVLQLSKTHHAGTIIAVATQAARETSNFADLQREIFAKTGVQLRTISGSDEARLIATGIHQITGIRRFISFDIGCGSVDVAEFDDCVRSNWSLPISAINLSQYENFADAEACVSSVIAKLKFSSVDTANVPLIGSGGTLRVASNLINGRTRDTLFYGELSDLFTRLRAGTYDDRIKIGVPRERVDIFHFGLLAVLKLMDHIGARRLFFTSSSLQTSLALDFFSGTEDE